MKRKYVFAFMFFALISGSIFAQVGFNVDVLPSNVGGKLEFKRVFEQEVMYPEMELKDKIGGKVTFEFLVKKDSSIAEVKITQHQTPSLDAEAQRLFNLFQWVPAMKGGQFVTTYCNASFDFNPDKYAKICKERGFKRYEYLPTAKVDSTIKIYMYPDQSPMYPKGNYALQDFIKANLEYPRQAQLANIQGTVTLRFVVEPTGLVTNIGVAKSVVGGCDQEAIRILEMIKWYPGKVKDKWARVEMTMPFYFILNEDFKDNSTGEQK